MKPLILASGSPRRKELLERAGYVFTIDPSDFDEASVDPASMPPHELARFLSIQKALDVELRDNPQIREIRTVGELHELVLQLTGLVRDAGKES